MIEQSQYGNPCHNLDPTQAYEVAHMMIEWPPTYKQLLFFFAIFPILYVWEAAATFFYTFFSLCLLSSCCFFYQISPLLSSPLFCRWWNCLSPYIIWNVSWWSKTCEKLGIITSRPYITFSILCYDALMLQVHDQMMIDMFLRPLLLLHNLKTQPRLPSLKGNEGIEKQIYIQIRHAMW